MITRILGDMLEVSDSIADNSVDLLLTDPPYNISEDGATPTWIDPVTGEDKNRIHSQRFDDSFEHDWDSVSHEEFIEQLTYWSTVWSKKLRPGGTFAIFISDRYISYLWSALEAQGLEPKRIITWKKPAAVPFNRSSNPISGSEFILWGIKPGKRTFNADAAPGSLIERMSLADKISSIVYKAVRNASPVMPIEQILQSVADEAQDIADKRKTDGDLICNVIPNTITYSGGLGKDKIHPTQKPTEILKYFIELCSREGDTVLDTFAGSGSTGKAAEELNRSAILIERDSKMFEKMNKRFN